MVDNTARKLDIGMEKSTLVVRPLFHGGRGTLILICILLVSLLILVVISIINQYRDQLTFRDEVDPVSGVTVTYTNEEPEGAIEGAMLLGINLLGKDHGLISSQLVRIMSFLSDYFDGRAEIVSYKKDSFQTDENNVLDKSFVVVADRSEVYTVRLALAAQDDPEPNITIEKEDYLWYN